MDNSNKLQLAILLDFLKQENPEIKAMDDSRLTMVTMHLDVVINELKEVLDELLLLS